MSKAQQEVVKAQLKNSTIYSPIDGVIARKWILEGDVVQQGQPIFTIFDMKNIWITAQFEETRLALVTMGAQVEISVDTYPDIKFSGKVIQIGSNTASQFSLIPPNNASGNFTKVTQRVPVKISIDKGNSNVNLLPGMSVEVRVKERI
jgi:membrane fusion protein (multidrug efflux system)